MLKSMNLSFKLYGTRAREQTIRKLANSLSLCSKDVFYDEQATGKFPFELMRTVWTTDRNNSETHRVILQDDIDICNGFQDICYQIANAHPDKIISLFPFDYQTKKDGELNKVSPYRRVGVISGCALLLPISIIDSFFGWVDYRSTDKQFNKLPETIMLRIFSNDAHIPVITTIPSTVQHIGDESLIYQNAPIGRTEYFEKNPIADWSSKIIL